MFTSQIQKPAHHVHLGDYSFVGVFDGVFLPGDLDFEEESREILGGEPPDNSWMGSLFLDVGVTLHKCIDSQ